MLQNLYSLVLMSWITYIFYIFPVKQQRLKDWIVGENYGIDEESILNINIETLSKQIILFSYNIT